MASHETSRSDGRRGRTRRAAPGLDFTDAIRRVAVDMTSRLPELSHIDASRIAFSFAQTRSNTSHGMYASLTPLRFEGGKTTVTRRGGRWTIQRVQDHTGREMLYILTFYLPRFLNLSFDQKLTTVVHELYHISPRCDGDLRRFRGRCYAHTGSQKKFDAVMLSLAKRWLGLGPPREIFAFLEHDFRSLAAQFGHVHGDRVVTPKVYRVA